MLFLPLHRPLHDKIPTLESTPARGTERENILSRVSRWAKRHRLPIPRVQNILAERSRQRLIVHDTSEETARARQAYSHLAYGPDGVSPHSPSDDPDAFCMPGTSPSEVHPYKPIWEKATTPPPPAPHIPKEQRESENRYPSLRINPPSVLSPGEGPY